MGWRWPKTSFYFFLEKLLRPPWVRCQLCAIGLSRNTVHDWPNYLHRNQIRSIDESEPLLKQLRYSHFMCHVVQTKALLHENYGWECKEIVKNLSKIRYYTHCPGVFENMKPFTTTQWNIWDLFPQNERQVARFYFQVITRFMLLRLSALKWYIICQGCWLIWGQKSMISLRNSFVFYWILKCSMSHISFSSLATCRSFCENRSHILKNYGHFKLQTGLLRCCLSYMFDNKIFRYLLKFFFDDISLKVYINDSLMFNIKIHSKWKMWMLSFKQKVSTDAGDSQVCLWYYIVYY